MNIQIKGERLWVYSYNPNATEMARIGTTPNKYRAANISDPCLVAACQRDLKRFFKFDSEVTTAVRGV